MSKEKNKQKETSKKAPEKTLKEKRAAKKVKEQSKKNG
jgi:hypothetical protein